MKHSFLFKYPSSLRILFVDMSKYILIILLTISINNSLQAQEKEKQVVGKFEVVSRKGLNEKNPSFYHISGSTEVINFPINIEDNTKTINVIKSGVYAKKVDRIISFDDGTGQHIVTDISLSIYSKNGQLVKSLWRVATLPFVATVTETGSAIIAGNKSKPNEKARIYLTKYDKNGNKVWENTLPDCYPQKLFVSIDEKYIALVLSNSNNTTIIQYFNSSGTLLFTDDSIQGITAVEFLLHNKVVVCTALNWYLYDIGNELIPLLSGSLKGIPLGEFPISTHPTNDLFTIVTEGNPGIRIQAFSSINGALVSESLLQSKSPWPAYRLVEISTAGNIQLQTSNEVIILKIKH